MYTNHTLEELERTHKEAAKAADLSLSQQALMYALLGPLKGRSAGSVDHYMHSLRVGLLGVRVADAALLPSWPLFLAGTLHDVGKSQLPASLLDPTRVWTKRDGLLMQQHVMLGYTTIAAQFPLAADIMVWHHRYQPNPYPSLENIPAPLYSEDEEIATSVMEYGRLLALTDQYDALHRKNRRHETPPSGRVIKARLLAEHPEDDAFIRHLYSRNIFTEEEV